ncbi:hypothetical protein COU91_03125 [Candidatus Saccharibacteria bacterium CG10_big_fil_rev_8_21_14_0_10_47_8]|nr:MAG: hypothetical protein COU91_03125 [Candidatus Saccharibacteria bacterium CG10_big_fil_rev_8_21_14_0_10_47_8]
MDIQPNNPLPQTSDMTTRPPAESYASPVSLTSVYPQVQTPKPRGGAFPWRKLLFGLALIALVVGVVTLSSSGTNSNIKSLQSQVAALEQKAKTNNLSVEDLKTLDNLQQDVKDLGIKTDNLPEDTKTELAQLKGRLDKLETTTDANGQDGANGTNGNNGQTGATGATGAQGAQGVPGSNDCIGGICVSRQITTPGTQETGNINISGTAIAGSFSGNGSAVTNVDAAYLNGFNAGYFTSASNLSSGTLANGRLSAQVTLQGNTFNGVSQLVQTTAGGLLPVLDGSNLTNLNAALLNGQAAGYYTNATNISSGTLSDSRLSTNVTLQGNTFNGASQLVQTTVGGALPTLSGVNLTALNASNVASGTIADGRLSANVALLNGTGPQTFTGNNKFTGTVLAQNTADSTAAFQIQNATGTTILLSADTTTGVITIDTLSVTNNLTLGGSLTFGTSISGSCGGLTNYVWVPGNAKFGTMPGFCVMKYEAKDDGSGNAVSNASSAPWVSISQRIAQDKAFAACAGCHLISEAEWMTIATDALWVNANWCLADGSGCGNAPGTASRFLATGHQDNSPAAALAASATDSEACYGTVTAGVNTTCGSAGTQKRTLTLSSGAVIWDIPGDVWEWTNSWIIGNEEPNDAVDGFAWHEFTAIIKWKDLNYANPTNRGWNSTQRLGQINTDGTSTNNTLYGFLRGGVWGSGTTAGAFALNLDLAPTLTSASVGFRVAR